MYSLYDDPALREHITVEYDKPGIEKPRWYFRSNDCYKEVEATGMIEDLVIDVVGLEAKALSQVWE